MNHTLSIARKLLSWKNRFVVTNAAGEQLYEATWRFAWFSVPWVVTATGAEVATIRRKLLAWVPTWDVQAGAHQFQLRQRMFSMRRRVYVVGGPFDGAELTGGFWDLSFRIEHRGRLVADADARLLTLRDRHVIRLHETDANSQLLTAVLMVHLMVQKEEEASRSMHGD